MFGQTALGQPAKLAITIPRFDVKLLSSCGCRPNNILFVLYPNAVVGDPLRLTITLRRMQLSELSRRLGEVVSDQVGLFSISR